MAEEDKQSIERLVKALETSYGSAGKTFWRGFLSGLGRGIGSLVGWLLLLAIVIYLFERSGLGETFKHLLEALNKLTTSLGTLPKR